MNNFCILIPSHGRPNNVKTIRALEKGGYTGKWYIVIDDEEGCKDEYLKLYGDKVIEFNKDEIAERFDIGDTCDDKRVVVYARNACFDIAEKLGVKYYLELDDDYSSFAIRRREGGHLKGKSIKNLDKIFEEMVVFLENSGALTVAFAQAGDFIGGANSKVFKKGPLLRKAMNAFFCKTERRFNFVGRINEDVNTYVVLGNIGKLLFTVIDIAIVQALTQKSSGGMTEVYLDKGTFLKSFYSVMYAPQAVRVGIMQSKNTRIHHKVTWNYCVPKILNERWKKNE